MASFWRLSCSSPRGFTGRFCASAVGALPFYLSGSTAGYTDAFLGDGDLGAVSEFLTIRFDGARFRSDPTEAEVAVLLDVYRAHLAKYQADKEAATKLINTGESKPDKELDPSQLAAWTMLGNLILNLDETMTKS